MENKFNIEIRKILILGLGTALIGGFVLALPVQAHSPKVHSPLMGVSADLYNSFYPEDALTHQEVEWLMQGAAEEDSPLLRPLHHFYDPVNNTGLPGYTSSKIWARDGAAQSGIGGDYSWEEALAAYKRGDKQKAYKSLGHVIHLIQDASVPAHVRNDPHPHGEILYGGADPFEQAVKDMEKFKIPSATGLSPTIYSDLDTYFDRTALHTNTHFYSKDSVGFYEKPVPVRVDNNYIYGKDVSGEYKLLKIKGKLNSKLPNQTATFSTSDPFVLQDYWNRLAPFTVEQSAGVIKLFKDSVEEEIIVKEEKISFWSKTTNFFSSVSQSAGSLVGWFKEFGFLASSSKVQVNATSTCGELAPYLMTSPGACTEYDILVSATTEGENNQAQQNFYNQLQNIATAVGSDPTAVESDTPDTTDKTDTSNPSNTSDNTQNDEPETNTADNEEKTIETEEETKQEGEVLGDSSANDTGFGNYGPTGPNQTFVRQENVLPNENEGAGTPAVVWSESISSTLNSQMLVDAGSNLYLAAGDTIQKFTPEGNSLWENTRSRTYVSTALSPDEENLYVVECEYNENNSNVQDCYFTAFSTSDGSEVIQRVSVGSRGNPMVPVPDSASDNVYIAARPKIYALNIFIEDVVVWEKGNHELGGDSSIQLGIPVIYGDKLYAVQRDGRAGGTSELAIVSKGTGEALNYLTLDVGAIWNTSNKLVLAGDKLLVAYTGPNCGASKRTGYAVYDTNNLDDMENSAAPAQTSTAPTGSCSGKILNLESNGEEAYIVPTKYGAYSIRSLTHLFGNIEGLIDRANIFTLDSTSTPTGKISISPDGTVYLFTEEESGSIIYGLLNDPEQNPVLQYNSEDQIKNLAAGEGIVYLLSNNLLQALGI